MLGKSYFIFIVLFIFFTNQYQYVTAPHYGVLEYLALVRDGLLALAGFSYFFHKTLLQKKQWQYIWYFLVSLLVLTFIKQLLPGSYYGDLEDGQLGANLLAYILSLVLFIPLYSAAYKLQLREINTKTKKR